MTTLIIALVLFPTALMLMSFYIMKQNLKQIEKMKKDIKKLEELV